MPMVGTQVYQDPRTPRLPSQPLIVILHCSNVRDTLSRSSRRSKAAKEVQEEGKNWKTRVATEDKKRGWRKKVEKFCLDFREMSSVITLIIVVSHSFIFVWVIIAPSCTTVVKKCWPFSFISNLLSRPTVLSCGKISETLHNYWTNTIVRIIIVYCNGTTDNRKNRN